MSVRKAFCGSCGAEIMEVRYNKLAVDLEAVATPGGRWRLTSNCRSAVEIREEFLEHYAARGEVLWAEHRCGKVAS